MFAKIEFRDQRSWLLMSVFSHETHLPSTGVRLVEDIMKGNKTENRKMANGEETDLGTKYGTGSDLSVAIAIT
jgi:hypothetical protein